MPKTSNKLTASILKSMTIGQSVYGSNLRATKNKYGTTFYANFTLNGNRYQEKIANSGKINLSEAIQAANLLRTQKERDLNLYAKNQNRTEPFLNEVASIYLKHLEIHQGKNLKKKEQHLRIHILPYLGQYKIKDLHNNLINEFRAHLLSKKGISHSTVNRNLSTLNHLCKFAIEEGFISSAPFKVKQYQEDYHGRDRIWPSEKMKLFEAAKNGQHHPMLYLFLLIGFGTGMRHMEILTMKWEAINWRNETVFLPVAKSGKRHQPLPSLVIKELQNIAKATGKNDGYVFAADTKTGHINDFSRQFKQLCKSCGLEKIYTPHFMRHTKVTELVEAGYPDNIIKEITGHRTSVMIAHYSHLRGSSAVRSALEAWNPLAT
ncbi:MAG: tyrosine-type recombinase/integrase [Rhodobacteraceae bacterium]|nr:tyrosine-type recombinase/integrase [Paracoccaceae bacterium]